MRSLIDLQHEIRPICERVETFRLEQYAKYKRGMSMMLIPLAATVLSLLWMAGTGSGGYSVPVGLMLIGASVIACCIIYFSVVNKHRTAYRDEFKLKILKTFVEMLYPTIRFQSGRSIDRSTFVESELFKNPDRFSGEDYFNGTLGRVQLEFSEVHAVDVTRSTDSKGNSKTSTSTIFKGLFFAIQAPQTVYSNVVVLPDSAERAIGGLGRWIQRSLGSLYQGKKMVYFEEHPEFEKQFVVYCNEEDEARRLLSPALLRTICELRNTWKNHIHIAFKGSRIYLALPMRKNLFETSIGKSLVGGGVLEELYQELALCFSAIEEFAEQGSTTFER